MIKVLNVISDTNIGGAGRVILNYAKYFDREAFDVSVAVPRGSALAPRLRELGVTVYEVDGMADKSLDLGAIGKLKRLIREVDPDIVHTHGSMSGRIAGRQCGKTVIYTRHSAFPVKSYIKKGPGHLINKLVNEHYADRIIAVSPATEENLLDGGISKDLIDVMMNGVEPVERVSPERAEEVRGQYGIEKDDFVLAIMARLEDYKGHSDILRAMKILRGEGRRVKLIIAGEGAYGDTLRRECRELGLDGSVIFAGFVSDVAPILSVTDVQLNASWGTEASSLAMLEAFSMGIPAVASEYGGNPWQVEDGVNGYLFPIHDAERMAEEIAAIMDDAELKARLSAGAERLYNERFTVRIFVKNVEDVYRKALEEKRHE